MTNKANVFNSAAGRSVMTFLGTTPDGKAVFAQTAPEKMLDVKREFKHAHTRKGNILPEEKINELHAKAKAGGDQITLKEMELAQKALKARMEKQPMMNKGMG